MPFDNMYLFCIIYREENMIESNLIVVMSRVYSASFVTKLDYVHSMSLF